MKSLVIHIIIAHLLTYFLLEYSEFAMTPLNYTLFLAVIYVVLWLLSFVYDREHFRKVPGLIGLITFFFKELFVANLRVAWDVITPVHQMSPSVIALPLDAKTDFEITVLANMISLTPGTLSIDIASDRKTLFVHNVYTDEGTEEVKSKIKNGFERKLLKITR